MGGEGSSSIVELGRFVTGFLVVMGVGEYNYKTCGRMDFIENADGRVYSTTSGAGALRYDPHRGNGHEHYWWTADLLDDNQFYDVLPGAGGVLSRREPFWMSLEHLV